MKLSPQQLAKLREIGRASYELDLRHEARRAAIATQRDYLLTLNHRLEQLPRARIAARWDVASAKHSEAAAAKCDQEEKRLRDEIQSAHGELDHLQEQLAELSRVNAPLRELLDRVRERARLSRGEAGLAFGRDAQATRAAAVEVV